MDAGSPQGLDPPATHVPECALVATRRAGRPTGWRKWLYRLAAATVVPAALFAFLELGLRLCDYGYATTFFLERRSEYPAICTENPSFGRRFFPAHLLRKPPWTMMAAAKPAGTYRIFILGESAAMGFPDASAGFARILEVMLRQRFPEQRFEVVNTAMTAINSHAILPIARECAGRQPDLFIVYMGNNEVVGPFSAAGVLGAHAPSLAVIRASLAVRTFRTGQLVGDLLQACNRGKTTAATWEGMAMFAQSEVAMDDPRLETTYQHFQQNLTEICAAGVTAGVPVVLCTVPVNLQDCAPFASVHAPGLTAEQSASWERAYEAGVKLEEAGSCAEALASYAEAAGIDDGFADLAFRRARCLRAWGRLDDARQEFQRARDLDALRFRCDGRINAAIRAAAQLPALAQVHLVDTEQALAAASASGIPGDDLFFEHVHLNFTGNYAFARAVVPTVARLIAERASAAAADEPAMLTEQQCAERLAHVHWNRLRCQAVIAEMVRELPFNRQLDNTERVRRADERLDEYRKQFETKVAEQLAVYKHALQAAPDAWMIQENLAKLLKECGMRHQAAAQYERLRRQVPYHSGIIVELGHLRLQLGDYAGARSCYEAALAIDPELTSLRFDLARVLAAEGKVAEATAEFKAQVDRAADRPAALTEFALFLAQQARANEAADNLREALALNPQSVAAHMAYGDLLARQGNPDEAIEHYEAAARIRPSGARVVAQLVAKLRARSAK